MNILSVLLEPVKEALKENNILIYLIILATIIITGCSIKETLKYIFDIIKN